MFASELVCFLLATSGPVQGQAPQVPAATVRPFSQLEQAAIRLQDRVNERAIRKILGDLPLTADQLTVDGNVVRAQGHVVITSDTGTIRADQAYVTAADVRLLGEVRLSRADGQPR